MTDARRYDFPAPLAFMALLGCSCAAALFGLPLKGFALMGVFWAGFGLVRALWMVETAFLLEDVDQKQRSMVLPWVILSGMGLRSRMDTGFRAMGFVDRVLVVVLLLGALYLCWMIFVCLNPDLPDGLQLAVVRARDFFARDLNMRPEAFLDAGYVLMLTQAMKVLMVGASLCLARSYTLSTEKSLSLIVLCGALFTVILGFVLLGGGPAEGPMAMLGHWRGYGVGVLARAMDMTLVETLSYSGFFIRSAELGTGGNVFLGMAVAMVAVSLMKNMFQPAPKRFYALGALCVLAALVGLDLFWTYGRASFSLALSGWALIGVLWQLSYSSRSSKRYRIHQA